MQRSARFLMAFPPFALFLYYLTWVCGRLTLGYWPRPSLDDPKNIHGYFSWIYNSTMIVMTIGTSACALLIVILVSVCVSTKPLGWKKMLAESGAAFALFLLLMIFSHWDPNSVVGWLLD